MSPLEWLAIGIYTYGIALYTPVILKNRKVFKAEIKIEDETIPGSWLMSGIILSVILWPIILPMILSFLVWTHGDELTNSD